MAKATDSTGPPGPYRKFGNFSEGEKKAVQVYGGNIIECAPTLEARESTLVEVMEEFEAHEVPPYNDARIIAVRERLHLIYAGL